MRADPPRHERFDRFMERALYGPRGYYTGTRTILGARGDFTTTPKMTTALAGRIGQWIRERWREYGGRLPVIEMGPGDGTLGYDIRRTFGLLERRKLDYHFVEISETLAARQKEKNKGSWHDTLKKALTATGGEALIISNEFFDAFPVRIFRRDLCELHLDSQGQEHWLETANLPDSTLFNDPPERFEVAESIHNWMKNNLSLLRRGSVLTIDYGGDAKEIYHRRPLGSLRAYAHHMRLLPPEAYQNPGHQDLTFDISFPDLIHWGNELNLETTRLVTQAKFLGSDDELGAGGAFKVLEWRTAPDNPARGDSSQ